MFGISVLKEVGFAAHPIRTMSLMRIAIEVLQTCLEHNTQLKADCGQLRDQLQAAAKDVDALTDSIQVCQDEVSNERSGSGHHRRRSSRSCRSGRPGSAARASRCPTISARRSEAADRWPARGAG